MSRLVATCALGTEDLLTAELRALGWRTHGERGAVAFEVDDGQEIAASLRACLHLRTAMRVLWPLAEFPVADADALYEGARAVAWERAITPKSTIAVTATTSAPPPLAHGPFLGQRVKDAVCDRLRELHGARPDVARDDPDVRLYVHVSRGRAVVGLDPAGDSLHLRGYRVTQTEAPLRETLAAAVILATRWTGERPLIDPMCGSGTLVLEAAAVARQVAPGLMGGKPRVPGCARWPSFGDAERRVWDQLVDEARAAVRPLAVPLIGSDRDPAAVGAAQRNAAAAGLSDGISWRTGDARQMPPLVPPGVLVTNPPYGERMGQPKQLEGFWRAFGGHLRTLRGHTAFVLAPPERLRWLGMRPTWERRMKNGPIDVSLARFEMTR